MTACAVDTPISRPVMNSFGVMVEASSHVLAVTAAAHGLEYLELAHAILAELAQFVDCTVTARDSHGPFSETPQYSMPNSS